MRLPLPRSGPPRVVAATTAVALATGAAGWLVGAQVRSPADAAAARRPPPASLITVDVQERTLTATVNAQGTLAYGAPRPIALAGSVAGGGGDDAAAPLITKVPAADQTLREGDVLLEVSGRPVFVLTGTVPMYRTLTRGSTGDDVKQLRAALRRLLPQRRLRATGKIDDRTLAAVSTWYGQRGYQATGPTTAQRTQLRELQRAVAAAKTAKTEAAKAEKGKEADKGADDGQTSTDAQALADAQADLAEYTRTYGTSVASGEILFLPRLPVQLTTVTAKTGAAASGVIGTVADPTLVVNGTVTPDDAGLLKVGMSATMEHPDGDTFSATLNGMGAAVAVAADPPDQGGDAPDAGAQDTATAGVPIRLKPKDPAKLAKLAGQAFKLSIKIGGTGKAVLSAPVAAVFTASDGQARVTVQDAAGKVRDVPVETGLSTGGYVQITPAPADALRAGDRVVVGSR